MAKMARRPSDIVKDVASKAHQLSNGDPPPLLSHPPRPGEPLPPIRNDPAMAALHATWERVHEEERGSGHERGANAGSSVEKVLRRLAEAGIAPLRRSHDADREMLGEVIRSMDTLARRVDELGTRIYELEALVEEVVMVTGEELTRVRAALSTPGAAEAPGARPGDA